MENKYFKFFRILNIVVCFLLVPLVLFSFPFILLYISSPLNLFSIVAFLAAIIIGFFSIKFKKLFAISFICWLIFGLTNLALIGNEINKNNEECLKLRQDENCIETQGGTLTCSNGNIIVHHTFICKDLIDKK